MRYLSLGEVLELHRRIVAETGGASAIRDLAGLESAVAQPRMTFGGEDLYPDLLSKAVALGFSIIQIMVLLTGIGARLTLHWRRSWC